MPGGLRVRKIVFAFPFYEREGFTDEDCERRTAVVSKVLSKVPFVTGVEVDLNRLRDPLYITINPHYRTIQDRSMADVESALEKILEKVYNFRQCL